MMDDACKQIATYRFSKNPETFIRVIVLFMDVPVSGETIVEQELHFHKRNGFTIVEWGGAEI